MSLGALEHAAEWCHTQGEPLESFALIADLWAADPEWAARVGWRRVLDIARRNQAEKSTAAPK